MKTICTLLLLTVISSVSIAQGISSFDALRSTLKEKQSNTTRYTHYLPETQQMKTLSWDNRWQMLPKQQIDPRRENQPEVINALLDSLLIAHAQLLQQQLSELHQQSKITLQKLHNTSHFSDSTFKAHIRTLYNSEVLFNYSFNQYATNDSLLLISYDTLVDSLGLLVKVLDDRISSHRNLPSKNQKTAFAFIQDISACYTLISTYTNALDSIQKRLHTNRTVLYEEEKKLLLLNNTFSQLNTVPSAISSLAGMNIVPGINILGQRIHTDEKGGKIVGAYLFLAAEPEKKDSTQDPDYKRTVAYNMLQPEASKFGFRFNYQKSFNISDLKQTFQQRAELQFQFNYLLKGIPKISSDSLRSVTGGATTGFIQLKAGGELFFAQHFSFFAAMNYLNAVQNNTHYLKYFALKNEQNDLFFINTGLTASLSWGKQQQDMRISLDFIVNNDAIRRLYNSTDPLIPFIRFSFTPTSL